MDARVLDASGSEKKPHVASPFIIRNPFFATSAAQQLRIDMAVRANVEVQFTAPPHQYELNGRSLPA
jgi:hypothetical protein